MTLFLWCSSKENNDSVHDNELFHKIKGQINNLIIRASNI